MLATDADSSSLAPGPIHSGSENVSVADWRRVAASAFASLEQPPRRQAAAFSPLLESNGATKSQQGCVRSNHKEVKNDNEGW